MSSALSSWQTVGAEGRSSAVGAAASTRPSAKPAAGHDKKNQKDYSFADLFLSGKVASQDESAKSADSALNLIPEPPGTSNETEIQPLLDKEESMRSKYKVLEMNRLQDYWKQYAIFPDYWPSSKASKERHEAFVRDFQGASKPVLTSGERIHCLAFVVVCAEKVGIRSTPTLSQDAQTGNVLHPGQCVVVEQIVSFDQVRFLKLAPGAWVFDRMGKLQVMQPMLHVDLGCWWYRVVSQDHIEMRSAPTQSSRARNGHALCPNEVCVVSLRCEVDGETFFLLADGRGWVFERRRTRAPSSGDSPPRSPRSPPRSPRDTEAPDTNNEVVLAECAEDKLHENEEDEQVDTPRGSAAQQPSRPAVESGHWQYQVLSQGVLALGSTLQGKLLHPGEKVHVNMRVPANGEASKEWSVKAKTTIINRIWLRLSDGRGWIPKSDVDGEPLVRFIGVALAGHGLEPPPHAHGKPGKDAGRRESYEAWMHGVA